MILLEKKVRMTLALLQDLPKLLPSEFMRQIVSNFNTTFRHQGEGLAYVDPLISHDTSNELIGLTIRLWINGTMS